MGAITIRRLDDETIARLKDVAKQHGRSMEEEARIILARSVGTRWRGQAAVEHYEKLQQEIFGDRILPDTLPIIQEMREADPTEWDGE
jgi:plasmid stability protein